MYEMQYKRGYMYFILAIWTGQTPSCENCPEQNESRLNLEVFFFLTEGKRWYM